MTDAMTDRSESDPRPLFRGDLAQTPLPEVLITVFRYKVPGVISCLRESEAKRIYIDDGSIIFATSTNVADSLGDRLLRSGRITREQYDESLRRLTGSGKRHGTILAEMGAIDPKTLFVSVREQVEEIVWSIFEWSDGRVIFEPGRERHLEFIKLLIPIPRAMLTGVRRMPDAKALVARIGTRSTVLRRTGDPGPERLELTEDEKRLLDAVDGKATLFDLTRIAPLTPAENAKVLYALFALRLIEPKPSRQIKVQIAPRKGR